MNDRRPLATFPMCPTCTAALEEARATCGEDGVAVATCFHDPAGGTFAIWQQGALTLKPCASPQQAQLFEAALTTLVARQQVVAEILSGKDEPRH